MDHRGDDDGIGHSIGANVLLHERDTQIPANLTSELVADLGVSRDGGPSVLRGVGPPRMATAFSYEDTPLTPEVSEKGHASHTTSSTSV